MNLHQKTASLAINIICKNEADRIGRCLSSVVGWADQVVVFDSGSTDGTQDIIRQYNVELFESDWPGYGPQRQRALEKTVCDFVLILDADEYVDQRLRDEIDDILNQSTPSAAVFNICWQFRFLNKDITHGKYANPQARLFRRGNVRFADAQVHETLISDDQNEGHLKARLHHNSYRNYFHCVQKHNQYATLVANEKYALGKSKGLMFATLRSFWEFLQQYFFKGLILDGLHGFLLAATHSQYAFNKYAGLWALHRTRASKNEKFGREANH